jgi:hypothetical protein
MNVAHIPCLVRAGFLDLAVQECDHNFSHPAGGFTACQKCGLEPQQPCMSTCRCELCWGDRE